METINGEKGINNMDGLVIKKKWIDLILSRKKTLEIRGNNTRKIGETVYILESGSHKVRGTCKIVGSKLITCQNWDNLKGKACLDISMTKLNRKYHTAYAWKLTEVELIKTTWYYNHPKGAVIWVKDVNPFYMCDKDV